MNKKKIFLIIILTTIISLIISFYIRLNKPNLAESVNNKIEIQEEQNIITQDTTQNIIENVENNKQNQTSNEIAEVNDTTPTPPQTKSDEKQETKENENNEDTTKKELEKTPAKNKNVTSTFDENNFKDNLLKKHPYYGEKYGTLKINKIAVNAPIYFGVTSEIISKGVGHDSGSYFPGENGTIIMCEHNYMNNFRRLGELSAGDIIEVKTDYGDFYYKVYDKQIIEETETDKLPVQHNKETLMIYTCYPFNNKGYTIYRYVVYANKI